MVYRGQIMKLLPLTNKKTCGDCTKCCEGFLQSNIEGHAVTIGQPCFFLDQLKGCTIYKDRPHDPCVTFNCAWLEDKRMPDEYKPNNCGVMIRKGMLHDMEFFFLIPAPKNPSNEMIEWAKEYYKKDNLHYCTEDIAYAFGSKEFMTEVRKHSDEFLYQHNINSKYLDRYYPKERNVQDIEV